MQLPYDPNILALGNYPREIRNYVHAEMCTQVFIAILFIMVQHWGQCRSASRRNKACYIAVSNKRNKLLIHATTWIHFQRILNKRKPNSQRHMLYIFIYVTFCDEQVKETNIFVVTSGQGQRLMNVSLKDSRRDSCADRMFCNLTILMKFALSTWTYTSKIHLLKKYICWYMF